MPENVRLQIQNISKSYPGVKALTDISFSIEKGEVHAICGENGAGKSTLMNILSGNIQPSEGKLYIEEKETVIANPLQAASLGIAIVHQEKSLIDNISIAENIYIGRPPKTRWGNIDFKLMYSHAQKLLDQLGLETLSANTLVSKLSAPHKQMVEIAKALSQKPSLLILDEPTASITDKEVTVLFSIIKALKKDSVSVLYISHRMAEIFSIADKVTVLKDGQYQGSLPVSEINENSLFRLMVGRDAIPFEKKNCETNTSALELKNVSGKGFRNVSFNIKKGEIVGLAGLIGAGRTEIGASIFGANTISGGDVFVQGKKVNINSTNEALRYKIGYVPEDRKEGGAFLSMTIEENIVAANIKAAGKRWFNQTTMHSIANEYKKKLNISAVSNRQIVNSLSGGNQQKVVLAKWLFCNSDILIVDEPTHGVDIGVKFQIYQQLQDLASEGKAILLISSELPELLLLSDKIIVIRQGSVAASVSSQDATEENLLRFAANG